MLNREGDEIDNFSCVIYDSNCEKTPNQITSFTLKQTEERFAMKIILSKLN